MFCHDKHTFVTTKDVFCRDKHVFVATKRLSALVPSAILQYLMSICSYSGLFDRLGVRRVSKCSFSFLFFFLIRLYVGCTCAVLLCLWEFYSVTLTLFYLNICITQVTSLRPYPPALVQSGILQWGIRNEFIVQLFLLFRNQALRLFKYVSMVLNVHTQKP